MVADIAIDSSPNAQEATLHTDCKAVDSAVLEANAPRLVARLPGPIASVYIERQV